jgi:hypothetical protein
MGVDECVFHVHGSTIHFVNILYPEAGSFILGGVRIVIFAAFALLNFRNHRLVAAKEGSMNMAYIRGLILPSYHEYFYILIAANVIAAIFDITTPFLSNHTADKINNIVLPLEMGFFHCLSEGFAVFLMRHGAGIKAFRHSLNLGIIWGLVSFVAFFVEIRCRNGSNLAAKLAFLVFFLYFTTLFVFYGCLCGLPSKYLYRRPALVYYSTFNTVYNGFLLVSAGLIAGNQNWAICPLTVIGLIFIAILQPFVIFRTLQIDSQYWQGRSINPLSDIWDEIDLTTASSMAAGLYEMERTSGHLPILHFGLISLDSSLGYVAGGYSRVYFGKLHQKKVALKIMYVMELTPSDVNDYYREATILHHLQHPNVVGCFGICVMPPALTLVLEFCLFGSLFDFIHKKRTVNVLDGFDDGFSGSVLANTTSNRSRVMSSAAPSPSDVRETAMRKLCGKQILHPGDVGLFRDTEIGDVRRDWSQTFGVSSRAVLSECQSDRGNAIRPKSSLNVALLEDDARSSFSSSRHSQSESSSQHTVNALLTADTQSVTSTKSFRVNGVAAAYTQPAPFESKEPSRHVSIDGGSGRDRRPSRDRQPSIMDRVRESIISITGFGNSSLTQATPVVQTKELLPFAHYLLMSVRIRMCLDCCRAVAHLHSKGYIHCDIKSLNFLVCEVRELDRYSDKSIC